MTKADYLPRLNYADPDFVQFAAALLTVINGVLKVPFAPNKFGPFTPVH